MNDVRPLVLSIKRSILSRDAANCRGRKHFPLVACCTRLIYCNNLKHLLLMIGLRGRKNISLRSDQAEKHQQWWNGLVNRSPGSAVCDEIVLLDSFVCSLMQFESNSLTSLSDHYDSAPLFVMNWSKRLILPAVLCQWGGCRSVWLFYGLRPLIPCKWRWATSLLIGLLWHIQLFLAYDPFSPGTQQRCDRSALPQQLNNYC